MTARLTKWLQQRPAKARLAQISRDAAAKGDSILRRATQVDDAVDSYFEECKQYADAGVAIPGHLSCKGEVLDLEVKAIQERLGYDPITTTYRL
jgi:hypothetical protein